MLPYLKQLKDSIWLKIILLGAACSLSAIVCIGIFSVFWHIGFTYSFIAAIMIAVLLAALLGNAVANASITPVDFLAKTTLLANEQDNQLEPPNSNSLGASKDFLVDLSKKIYGLADIEASSIEHQATAGEYFKTIAGILPLPLFVLNRKREIAFANAAAADYVGLAGDEIINKPFYDVLNFAFFSDNTLEKWLDDANDNRIVADSKWERVKLELSNGEHKMLDMAARYSKHDTQDIETVLILFDKTSQYERDDHDLSFVSLAAHELRNPLTVMRGYVELFEDELGNKLNNEQTAFMHNMAAATQQLTNALVNILDVAKIEQNALDLKIIEEDWNKLLTSACREIEPKANAHGKKFAFELDENIPTVAVDEKSIYTVITNLLDNAIKYTHTDEVISIKTYEKDGLVETTITDHGVGIDSSIISHIFDKFYRGHHSKNSVGGTGLGLYLCRAILSAQGGHIWVKSIEGKGSTFGFTLPVYASVADQIKSEDNKGIVRGAHGWIKNHSLYRE